MVLTRNADNHVRKLRVNGVFADSMQECRHGECDKFGENNSNHSDNKNFGIAVTPGHLPGVNHRCTARLAGKYQISENDVLFRK